MFATAVTIENRVIDPSTGLWRTNGNRTPEASFVSACEGMILECRNWIRKQCGHDDADSLQCTNDALEAATPAIDMMQNLEMALEENVQDPGGGRSPIRVVMANHRSDQMLAADREREGDNRHLDRPVARAWIAADAELRSAGGWLLGAAVATAVIGPARVAYLARISNLSVVEAALFAVVAALFLGGLVVLMGFLSCRGNRLGDRLGIGTGIVEAVEQRDRECRENVADAQERARRWLVTADQATARGDETRAWVIEGYLRSMMLARDWCDLDPSVFDGVQPRFNASSRPLAEQAAARKSEALAVLETVVIAVVTASPEGEPDRQVTGSAPVRSTTVAQPPASLVWAGSVAVTS